MTRDSLGVDWNSAGRPEPCAKEMSAGRVMLFADHAVLLRAVADEVKGMEHGDDCPVAAQEWRHMHEDGPMPRWDECNCPRGKVLAMLEVA